MATEVISAWDVYLVMQLDTISGLFVGLLVASSVICAGLFVVQACHSSDDHWSWNEGNIEERKELRRKLRAYSAKTLVVAMFFALASATLPSTRTAAAMLVLPAIANNETIQKEAGELYGLAKEALREAVGGDEDGGPKK